LLGVSLHYGLGRHNGWLDKYDMVMAEKYLFVSQPPYAWALVFAKISMSCTLLRILGESRKWRWILYAIIVTQVLIGVTINSFQFTLCRPLPAIWDPDVATAPGTVCAAPEVAQTSIFVTASITIFTDVLLSLIPLTFIVRIQRPLREKIAVGIIMGLGIVASISSIYKTTLAKNYGVTGDTLTDGVALTIWSVLEVQLGMIAACLPALKQLFERVLGRMGLISSQRSGARSGYINHADQDSKLGSNNSHNLSSLRSARTPRSPNNHNDMDGDSVDSILGPNSKSQTRSSSKSEDAWIRDLERHARHH
ncbi:hypothetical protein GQ53DRAFT_669582, partial [Thozetella sp. PMI_491]